MWKNLVILSISIILAALSCGGPGEYNSDTKKSSVKEFITFSFKKKNNPALSMDVVGSVNNYAKTIIITIKQSEIMDLSALKADFTFEGSYVMVGKDVQQTTITANDFKKPVYYRIFAEDNTSADYKVMVEFSMTYPYKPGVSQGGLTGDVVANNSLKLNYTYRDRNGDRQKATVVEWQVEDTPYSGTYTTMKTELISDPAVIGGSEITQENSSFFIPANIFPAKESCRIKVRITPHSYPADSPPDLSADYFTGFPVEVEINTVIKCGFLPIDVPHVAGLLIDEICVGEAPTPDSSYDYKKDEYIVLYNPNSYDIDLEGFEITYYDYVSTQWKTFCAFTDDELEIPPSQRDVNHPEKKLKKIVPSKGYFLIAGSASNKNIKKKADIILKSNSIDIPENKGSVKIVARSLVFGEKLIDYVGYGAESNPPPIYEGPAGKWVPAPKPGEKMQRYLHADIDNNYSDFKLRPVTRPMGSGLNPVTDKPTVTITGVVYDRTEDQYEVNYTYKDWQFNDEGESEIIWEVFMMNDAGTELVPLTLAPSDKWDNSDENGILRGKTFNLTYEDHQLRVPVGKAPYIMVSVTPKSTEGIVGDIKTAYFEDDTPGAAHPIAPIKPAKLIISRVLPTQNIVEFYVQRGGSLDNIRLGCVMAQYETDNNPRQDRPFLYKWSLNSETVYSGEYIVAQTSPVDSSITVRIQATPARDLIDTINYAAYKGIVLEVLTVKGLDDENNEIYDIDDALVLGLNRPSESAPAIKRYIVIENKNRLLSDNELIWKTKFDLNPGPYTTLYEKYCQYEDYYTNELGKQVWGPVIRFADSPLQEVPSDTIICDNHISANDDFIILSETDPGNYIMYRSADDYNIDNGDNDFTYDYIAPTEYFLNNFSVNYFPSDQSFTVFDPDVMTTFDSTPYVEIANIGADKLTGITFSPVLITIGSTKRLIPVFNPSGSSVHRHLEGWGSSDTSIVTVDQEGLVTAVNEGTATILLSMSTRDTAAFVVGTCTVSVKSAATTGTKVICFDYNAASPGLVQKDAGDTDNTFPLVEVTYNYNKIVSSNIIFGRGDISLHSFPADKLIERNDYGTTDTNSRSDFIVRNKGDFKPWPLVTP